MADEFLTIGDVARRTGLSARALRHYEAEGLLAPARSENGRRAYGPRELERLARLRLLKKAGFTLAQIRLLTTVDGDDRPNFARLVAARREALEAERDALDRSIALLCASERDLATAGAVSADALCRIIEMGERAVAAEQWKKIYDRYYTDDEQEEWRAAKERAFADVDLDAYERRWTDLAARIEAALPLDPGSEQAQSLLKEWNELLSVFMDGASPRMQENAGRLWANFDDWKDDVDQPISPRVWAFVKEASSRAAG